jgi:bifunctional non-homologous end joining protein LigD
VAAIKALRPRTLLLDGEVVVFDRKGISRFQLLQQKSGGFVYAAFDCLFYDGKDLREQPLAARRAVLQRLIGRNPTLRVSRRLAANGLEAYRAAKRRGYEGLVAKDASSAYVEARSSYWLKVKVHQEDEFIICGYTKPTGARQHFGALLLGAYRGEALRFVGKVGTGFDVPTLAALWKRFQPLVRSRSALANPPRDKGAVFIAPKLVAQISYQEWTSDQKLRQPVFLGLRDDKSAREVAMPAPSA